MNEETFELCAPFGDQDGWNMLHALIRRTGAIKGEVRAERFNGPEVYRWVVPFTGRFSNEDRSVILDWAYDDGERSGPI